MSQESGRLSNYLSCQSHSTPYRLVQGGLLEDTGEVYVGYLDYFDYYWKVLISDANQETWRVVDIAPVQSMYLTLAG